MARPKIENHHTAQLILESARKHFLQKGFAGTSINDVANDAKIHKSLIYHHFENKEGLWKAVKEQILNEAVEKLQDSTNFSHKTFKEYLKEFVTFRFWFYAHNPEIVRLMGWQRLETQGRSLAGMSQKKFTDINSEIAHFQRKGEVRSDLSPEVVSYLMMSMASNGFMDKEPFLKSRKGQEHYLRIIIEGLMKILNPKL